jgi:hypothetical protein
VFALKKDNGKTIIKEWINEEVLSDGIEALNFVLYKSYGIEDVVA